MGMTSLRVIGLLVCLVSVLSPARASAADLDVGERPRLMQRAKDGTKTELPLVRGHLSCEVRGPIAQVVLTQRFHNPSDTPIEAVYVFPLHERSAVGGMTMRIGDRIIRAVIEDRDAARKKYETAVRDGKTAALLEQERPNIFTQSVGNILPGEDIDIELTYDVLLEPDGDQYELALPTVVGPRYIPGDALPRAPSGGGTQPDTDQVQDASRISPPIMMPGESTGATYGVDLDLDAGLPITEVTSPTHEIDVDPQVTGHKRVTLAAGEMAADKDLVIRWRVVVKTTALAVLADHTGSRGHLAVVIQPPATLEVEDTPREIVFVLDTSGSMDGEPLAIVKRGVRRGLDTLGPDDAFRIINFSTDVGGFRDGEVVRATAGNIRDARSWLNGVMGDGGTEMIRGIRAALPGPPAGGRQRFVVFMTDGFIGNEQEILEAIAELRDSRTNLFSFGVGSSANRYLLDEMARAGNGVVSYLLLDEDPVFEIDHFFARIAEPALSDLAISWDGVSVDDASPAAHGALYAGRPIVIAARYDRGGLGTLKVRGTRGGRTITMHIPVDLPTGAGDGAVLGRLWARRRIAELSSPGRADYDARDIKQLALGYSLMSPYTSFVAVEERRRTDQPARQIQVPVDLPEGVSVEAARGYITNDGSVATIDQGSTKTGMTIDQEYVKNIPVPGRTFESALGAAAGSQGDVYGQSFSGSMSLENQYYVDGINTTGLHYGSVGGGGRGVWRLSLDAGAGYDLRGERAIARFSPSVERHVANRVAIGLTGSVWRLDGRNLASALATIARWSILRLFDVRLGFGLAFGAGDLGPAWQVRLAAPLPLFGETFRPELTLGVEGLSTGDERAVGGTLGIGVRF